MQTFHTWRQRALLLLPLALALVAGACTLQPPPRNVTLVQHQTTIMTPEPTVAPLTTETARCAAGEQLLSGGYTYDYPQTDNNTFMAVTNDYIMSSYPSDAAGMPTTTPIAWTAVVFNASGGATLTVFVNCLRAPFSLGLQDVRVDMDVPAGTEQVVPVRCPTTNPTIALSGGFKTDSVQLNLRTNQGNVVSSNPSFNGWVVKVDYFPQAGIYPTTEHISVFALCATNKVMVSDANIILHFIGVPASNCSQISQALCIAISQGSGEVGCRQTSQTLISGAFSDVTHETKTRFIIVSNTAKADFSTWQLQVRGYETTSPNQPGASGSVNVWAVCVIMPQS